MRIIDWRKQFEPTPEEVKLERKRSGRRKKKPAEGDIGGSKVCGSWELARDVFGGVFDVVGKSLNGSVISAKISTPETFRPSFSILYKGIEFDMKRWASYWMPILIDAFDEVSIKAISRHCVRVRLSKLRIYRIMIPETRDEFMDLLVICGYHYMHNDGCYESLIRIMDDISGEFDYRYLHDVFKKNYLIVNRPTTVNKYSKRKENIDYLVMNKRHDSVFAKNLLLPIPPEERYLEVP